MQKTKWEKLIEKYIFLFKDGFFELPYLSNTPELMCNSVIENPFSKHNVSEKSISSNNAFCRGTMFYRKIDDNFWLLPTYIEIKQNIIAKAVYDDNVLSNFFILSFSKFNYEFPVKNHNGTNVKLQSVCWTLYKPKTEVETYFYKNTKGRFYNIIFDKQWIDGCIIAKYFPDNKEILHLFDNEVGFYTWLDVVPEAHDIAKKISQIVQKENNGIFNTIELQDLCKTLILKFITYIIAEKRLNSNNTLSNLDYSKIAKAEKMILLHLSTPFIGVHAIAEEINMSPSKLKADFKTVYNFSMLQYHKEKNIVLARQLIIKTDAKIQLIAQLTGYDSASKFSAAFKKRFNILPLLLRKSQMI